MNNKYVTLSGLNYFMSKLNNKFKTESEINTLITQALNNYKQNIISVVTELPETGTEGFLYLVPSPNNALVFDAYTWEESDTEGVYEWKQLSKANAVSVDLTNYYTKSEIDTTLSDCLLKSDMVEITTEEIDNLTS